MKDTVILTIKLLLITAIVAALLGAVNMVTEPIIAENAEKSTADTMKELLPDADIFDLDGTKIPESKDAAVTVGDVYCGLNNDDEVVGYISSAVCGEGYGGDIGVMVSVDLDCKVIKAKVTEMSETPGLGAKSQTEWIDQYSGLGQSIQVSKNGSESYAEYKVDAISGATITSNAVTKAVNAVLDAVRVVIDDNMPSVSQGIEFADGETVSDNLSDEADTIMPESEDSGNSESFEDFSADENLDDGVSIDVQNGEGGAAE